MCDNCIHKPVCSKFIATGGRVNDCEHLKIEGKMKTAHWEWYEHAYDWNIGGYVCSNCRAKNDNLPGQRDFGVNDPYLYVGSKFCPNCGRPMVKPKTF